MSRWLLVTSQFYFTISWIFVLAWQEAIMASEDAQGNKVHDACFSCCSTWSLCEPSKPWSECCERPACQQTHCPRVLECYHSCKAVGVVWRVVVAKICLPYTKGRPSTLRVTVLVTSTSIVPTWSSHVRHAGALLTMLC